MNTTTLFYFRALSDTLNTEPTNWQWIGPHMSQRMFGITKTRAQAYAARHGGVATELVNVRELARKSWE